jgi:hypothetical protein
MGTATGVLLQYGAVGLIAILALIVAKMMYDRWCDDRDQEVQRLTTTIEREQQRADRAEERADRIQAELGRLNETVRNDYVHTLSAANLAMAESSRAVADALAAVRRR